MRHEPLDLLMAAAIDALKPLGVGLRERGWNAQIIVRAPDENEDTGQRTVALEIWLDAKVPVEYTEVDESLG